MYVVGVTPEIRTYRPISNPEEDVTVNVGVDVPVFVAPVMVVVIAVERSKLTAWIGCGVPAG